MANVHPCQVECTLMAFPQTASMEIWSSLMVPWERVITPWSKLICFLPDELLYFIVGWHLKVIMALLTLDHSSCSTASRGCQLLSLSISLGLRRRRRLLLADTRHCNEAMTRMESTIWGSTADTPSTPTPVPPPSCSSLYCCSCPYVRASHDETCKRKRGDLPFPLLLHLSSYPPIHPFNDPAIHPSIPR